MKDYTNGFMAETGYRDEAVARDQISAMDYEIGTTYDQGVADGQAFVEIFGKQVEIDGAYHSYDHVVEMMDDEIRERLHNEMSPCTEQAFVDAYLEEDEDLAL